MPFCSSAPKSVILSAASRGLIARGGVEESAVFPQVEAAYISFAYPPSAGLTNCFTAAGALGSESLNLRRCDQAAHLFRWFGIVERDFEDWLRAFPCRVHPGLVSFGSRTGGGQMFETETMLGPLAPGDLEKVLKVNEVHWRSGMPRDMVLFHVGSFHSVSYVDRRRHRNRILTLKRGTYEVERHFDTLTAWYLEAVRSEFLERYDLDNA